MWFYFLNVLALKLQLKQVSTSECCAFISDLFIYLFFTVNARPSKTRWFLVYSPTSCRGAAFSTFPTLVWPSAPQRMEFTHLLNSAGQKSSKSLTKCGGGEDAAGKGTIIQGHRVRDTFLPNANWTLRVAGKNVREFWITLYLPRCSSSPKRLRSRRKQICK